MKRSLYLLFLIPVCLLSVLTVMYLFSRTEPVFLLKNIKIKGVSQLSESEILTRIYPYLRGSIFETDMGKVKEAIVAHPFVRDVRVKRTYPFSILIDVKERVPSALWVSPAGDIYVLDEEGLPYRRLMKGCRKGLFIINGGKDGEAPSIYREVVGWDREGIMEKDAISEVVYREGDMTLFSLEDGVEIILGKEDQGERLKRAVTVLDNARKRGLLIRCIDARFEKGAIVKETKG
jgi:cell division protein FtsQ